ncbi:MAG: transglycosylase domain-containing protein [Acidimicrobiaceae bacterium]|nr:transglycosylase domain-containing protein [Acidimicrobiaceae bacterium]
MDTRVMQRPTPDEAAGQGWRARRRLRWARRPRWLRWLLRFVAAGLAAIVLLLAGLLILILTSPSVSDAPRRVAGILAAHHSPSDNGVIPDKVATALLATENSRFYHDPAIDPLGLARAVKGVLTSNGNEGGATIEQQLAKMLYSPGTGYLAQVRQVGEAFRLDQTFSKHTILAMYLDAAYFGDGAYGVTAAARHYFGLAPRQLSWAQASLLAGLVQAPTQYDPHGHLQMARERQQHVLSRLVATHGLTRAEAAAAWSAPLHPAVAFFG